MGRKMQRGPLPPEPALIVVALGAVDLVLGFLRWVAVMLWIATMLDVATGCTPRTQAIAANTMAGILAASAVAADTVYRARIDTCAEIADEVGKNHCISGVLDSFEPLWAAQMAYAEAHDAFADALASGGEVDFDRVTATFCALRYAFKVHGVEVPNVMEVCP